MITALPLMLHLVGNDELRWNYGERCEDPQTPAVSSERDAPLRAVLQELFRGLRTCYHDWKNVDLETYWTPSRYRNLTISRSDYGDPLPST